MRVITTRNAGATADYWRFPWLRYKKECTLKYEPPLQRPNLKHPFISARHVTNDDTDVYYPLEAYPGISRQFAAIRNPDSALAFANAYGLLGIEDVPRYRDHHEEIRTNGEDANIWIGEANELRQVYEVLDLVHAENEAGLIEIVDKAPHGILFISPKTLGMPKLQRSRIAGLKKDQVVSMAKEFIAERYNRKMLGMASPTLLLDAKKNLHSHNTPTSLLGALWLEFGGLASGARKQVLCESCGEWMDVTGNRSHKRKHTRCSNREKMARLRAKNKASRV